MAVLPSLQEVVLGNQNAQANVGLGHTMIDPGHRHEIFPDMSSVRDPAARKSMIAMRLRLSHLALMPWDMLETHYVEGEDIVIVFVAPRDRRPIMLEDSGALFPSDALITQLRLLAQ